MPSLTHTFWGRIDADDPPVQIAQPTPRKTGPLLMGDILMSFGGEPEFVRRWREDRVPDN